MKNDLKYIIKKIIIGIGIALGIMFFKPYIAFADTFLSVSVDSNGSYSTVPSDFDVKKATLTLDSTFTGDTTPVFLNLYVVSRYSSYWNNYILFRNLKNNSYLLSTFRNDTAITDLNLSVNENGHYGVLTTASFFYNNLLLNKNGGLNENSTATSFSKITFTTNEGNIFYGLNDFNKSSYSALNINQDYEIVETNISNLTINNIPWEEYYSPIPSGYEQINLNGYQGVLVTPKNFNTMLNESSHTEQPIPGTTHTYLDLDYYSQNCVRGVLINIQNVQNILTSDISSGSGLGASAGAINGTCFEEPTQTILSYQYDIYSGFTPQGILIYNNQKIEPNWDSGFNSDFNPFGESFVWVNTNLYNYYLIPNLSTFNADINYVDYDNTDKNLKIENLPTFEDLIKDTQLNQDSVNDNLNTRAKLESIFSFVKIPFTFLNNLINGTCEPLTARFPHSSTDIVLPCLSSSFAGWLGEQAYKGFQLIINGLLVYKIVMSLIQFTTKNLDPSDARIEVLDL